MAKKSALHSIAQAACTVHRPKRSWFSRLPAEAQAEMAEVKREWLTGTLQGTPFSTIYRGIVARCTEVGWHAPDAEQTISRWLRSPDR
ncbi:MAG: hypothetical protein EBR82_42475 [Caulobacteraceae bacterium]|nr:hypothetical protein [Caulobacteraceae bacterium]